MALMTLNRPKSDKDIVMSRTSEMQSELSRKLKQAREEAELTQDQLADLASISNRTIYLFENDKGSIRLDTYLKLLDALGMELHVSPRRPRMEGE